MAPTAQRTKRQPAAPVRPRRPPVVLTPEGAVMLADRVRLLQEQVLPELQHLLADPDRDRRVDIEHDRVLHEVRAVRATLDEAQVLDRLAPPVDPAVVQLGSRVTVEFEDGRRERYLLVHAAEAHLDGERISVESPFAQAVRGLRAGETSVVTAPSSTYRCRVVEVEWPTQRPAGG